MSQPRSFNSNAIEDVIDETVHDAHRLRTDSCAGMDLLHNKIPFALLFLVTLRNILLCLTGFFSSFTCLGWPTEPSYWWRSLQAAWAPTVTGWGEEIRCGLAEGLTTRHRPP